MTGDEKGGKRVSAHVALRLISRYNNPVSLAKFKLPLVDGSHLRSSQNSSHSFETAITHQRTGSSMLLC